VRDDQHAWALYAQNTLELARGLLLETDTLVLTTAARFDWIRHQIGDASPAGDGPSSDGTSTFSRLNPRVGLNYNLSPAAGLYAVYAQGFRAPAFLELTCANPGAVCPGLQAGRRARPPLEPVVVDHYEVGARVQPVAWLELGLALFRTDARDDIFAVSRRHHRCVLPERRRHAPPGRGAVGTGRPRPALGAAPGYAYTEATSATTSRSPRRASRPAARGAVPAARPPRSDIPLIPRQRINAGVDHHLTPWLTLWLSGAYVGSQRLRGDEENVERTLSRTSR